MATTPLTPEKIAEWKTRNLTDANVRLNRLAKIYSALRSEISQTLEHHGQDCVCGFCDEDGDELEMHLRGLAYQAEIASTILDGLRVQLTSAQVNEAHQRIAEANR